MKIRPLTRSEIPYISATPSENTVNFYIQLGCVLATEIGKELFALEPKDIHLEFVLEKIEEASP